MIAKTLYRRLQPWFSLILLPFAASISYAQPSPEAVEELLEFVRPTPEQIRTDLQELERELYRIESEFDAYDPAVAEVSADIGNRLAERGFHSEALVAYRRSLHVLRINEGLNSVRQIPILESIVRTHIKAGEFEEASGFLDRVSSLYTRVHGQLSPELIPHLIELGNWHLSAFQFDDGGGQTRIGHLQEARDAYSKVADIRAFEHMTYDPEIYSALSSINFNLALEQQAVLGGNLSPLSLSSSQLSRELRDAQRALASSAERGRSLLERGLRLARSSSDVGDDIIALIQLGDWEQLYNNRLTARDRYLEAYTLTQELTPDHELSGLFSSPKRLPVFNVSNHVETPQTRKAAPVRIAVDVSEWGQARNVKVVREEGQDRNSAAERAALHSAREAVYRPQIVDGKIVKTENFNQIISILI